MNRTNPELVDIFSVGKSYEGRPLYVLQVVPKKNAIVVNYNYTQIKVHSSVSVVS